MYVLNKSLFQYTRLWYASRSDWSILTPSVNTQALFMLMRNVICCRGKTSVFESQRVQNKGFPQVDSFHEKQKDSLQIVSLENVQLAKKEHDVFKLFLQMNVINKIDQLSWCGCP